MSITCMHDPKDIPGKMTYRSGRIHKKQLCRVCGWVREYSLPSGAGGQWLFGEWAPPDKFVEHGRVEHG